MAKFKEAVIKNYLLFQIHTAWAYNSKFLCNIWIH